MWITWEFHGVIALYQNESVAMIEEARRMQTHTQLEHEHKPLFKPADLLSLEERKRNYSIYRTPQSIDFLLNYSQKNPQRVAIKAFFFPRFPPVAATRYPRPLISSSQLSRVQFRGVSGRVILPVYWRRGGGQGSSYDPLPSHNISKGSLQGGREDEVQGENCGGQKKDEGKKGVRQQMTSL